MLYDHIMTSLCHNKPLLGRDDEYFIPPSEVKEMLDTEGGFLRIVEKIKNLMEERKKKEEESRRISQEIASRDRSDLAFSYCPFSGEMVGCRQ